MRAPLLFLPLLLAGCAASSNVPPAPLPPRMPAAVHAEAARGLTPIPAGDLNSRQATDLAAKLRLSEIAKQRAIELAIAHEKAMQAKTK